MNKLTRKTGFVLAGIWLSCLVFSLPAQAQENEPFELPVEVLPVSELPVSLTNSILSSTDKGYVLKCQILNGSSNRIVELTYLLLVQNPTTKTQSVGTQTSSLKLAGASTMQLTLQAPKNLKIKAGDRVVLIIQAVVSRRWLWAVLNSRQALTAFARDGSYVVPEVKRVLNQVDSRLPGTTIY